MKKKQRKTCERKSFDVLHVTPLFDYTYITYNY